MYDGLNHLVDGNPPESISASETANVATIAARLARNARSDLDHTKPTDLSSTEQTDAVPLDRFDVALETPERALPLMLATGRWSAPTKTTHHSSLRIQRLVAVLLTAALAAQIIHFYRASLASVPIIGTAVLAAYRQMGIPVEAHWDPASYEIQKIERVDADTPGTLRLHARIINHGIRAQPAPFLRVTLLDAHGQALGRREFTSHEYAADQSSATRLMPPDERLEAKLLILDPGSAAVSYRLEACLPFSGHLACSAEPHSESHP